MNKSYFIGLVFLCQIKPKKVDVFFFFIIGNFLEIAKNKFHKARNIKIGPEIKLLLDLIVLSSLLLTRNWEQRKVDWNWDHRKVDWKGIFRQDQHHRMSLMVTCQLLQTINQGPPSSETTSFFFNYIIYS